MAAKPEDEITQPEMIAIAREIPADKIELFATEYLGIDDTELSHIEDEAKGNSVRMNFKCILHWYRNTLDDNRRNALCAKLENATKKDLASKNAADVLRKSDGPTDNSIGNSFVYFVLLYIVFVPVMKLSSSCDH